MTRKFFAGTDAGCNYTKIYGGKGLQIAIRSTVSTKPQIGVNLVGRGADEVVLKIDGNTYAVGPNVSDPIDTRYSSFYTSDVNASLALAALLRMFGDLSDASVDAVFGMPLNVFYNSRGETNHSMIKERAKAWRRHAAVVSPSSMRLPVNGSVFGNLNGASEGVAVYLDYMLNDEGVQCQEAEGLVVVVDIGGNTTDLAMLENGNLIFGGPSTSFEAGALHLYERVANSARDLMGLMRTPPLSAIERAIREEGGWLQIGNSRENIRHLVADERRALVNEIIPRIEKTVTRRLDEISLILFAGGTSKLLEEDLRQVQVGNAKVVVVEDPQFANARGYYKLARHLAAQDSANKEQQGASRQLETQE
jgi:hypothetical protein